MDQITTAFVLRFEDNTIPIIQDTRPDNYFFEQKIELVLIWPNFMHADEYEFLVDS